MNPTEKEPEVLFNNAGHQPGRTCATRFVWLVVLVAVGIACVHIVMPATYVLRRTSSHGDICRANLSAVARACLMYAEVNQGLLPAPLSVLTEGGRSAYLKPKQLICPVGGRPYIYVPNMRNTDDPGNVMVYEPLENYGGEGTYVAFLDGHVKWCTVDCFRELLLKAQTQPASAPGE